MGKESHIQSNRQVRNYDSKSNCLHDKHNYDRESSTSIANSIADTDAKYIKSAYTGAIIIAIGIAIESAYTEAIGITIGIAIESAYTETIIITIVIAIE